MEVNLMIDVEQVVQGMKAGADHEWTIFAQRLRHLERVAALALDVLEPAQPARVKNVRALEKLGMGEVAEEPAVSSEPGPGHAEPGTAKAADVGTVSAPVSGG